MKRARLLVPMLALLAACGGTTPLTQIVVEADSDLHVPDELDALDVQVVGGTNLTQSTHADLTQHPLPASLGLVHAGGPLGPVRVKLSGLLAGQVVIERLAIVSFVQDESLLLRMTLSRACLSSSAPVCSADKTCQAGTCVSANQTTLPTWTGKLRPSDVGSAGMGRAGGGGAGTAGNNPPIAGRAGSGAGGAGKGSAGVAAGTGGAGGADAGTPDAGVTDGAPGVNQPPTCTISKPLEGATFYQGDTVAFVGVCSDPETGALSTGLRWDSNLDGLIGMIARPSRSNLSVGDQAITFCGSDPADAKLKGCATLHITVNALPAIGATISSLRQGLSAAGPFAPSSSIVAMGSGTGVDPVTLAWNDSMVGPVGSTATATLTTPLVGKHLLTLTATDSRMRTGGDTRNFVVLAAGQTQLIAPLTLVNTAVGRVDALAADTMSSFAAADSPSVLYSFAAGDPTLSSPTPSVAVTIAPYALHDVFLDATSGLAYLATSGGLESCAYAVSGGIDSSMCTTTTGTKLPSNNVAAALRLTVSATDYLVIGTSQGLFVPDDVGMPDGKGNKLSSSAVIALAANSQTLQIAAADGLYYIDLTVNKPFSSNARKAVTDGNTPTGNFTDVALGNTTSTVWIASSTGIARLVTSTGIWTSWHAPAVAGGAPSLPSEDVRSIAVSRTTIANVARDVVWIATAAGLSRFDPSVPSFTNFTTDDGLPSNSIRTVLLLSNGDKLIGTDAGVALYKGL